MNFIRIIFYRFRIFVKSPQQGRPKRLSGRAERCERAGPGRSRPGPTRWQKSLTSYVSGPIAAQHQRAMDAAVVQGSSSGRSPGFERPDPLEPDQPRPGRSNRGRLPNTGVDDASTSPPGHALEQSYGRRSFFKIRRSVRPSASPSCPAATARWKQIVAASHGSFGYQVGTAIPAWEATSQPKGESPGSEIAGIVLAHSNTSSEKHPNCEDY